MKNTEPRYLVEPAYACNDAAQILHRAQDIIGYNVRDRFTGLVEVPCETEEEAQTEAAKLNSEPQSMVPAEEMTSHFIPPHFFEKGQYEVWAQKRNEYGAPLCLIADKLSLKTARFYHWPNKQIRHPDWRGYRLLNVGEQFGEEGDEFLNKKWHKVDPTMQKPHIVEAWEQSLYRRPLK